MTKVNNRLHGQCNDKDACFNGGRFLCSRYCQTKWDKIGNCCFSAVRVKIMFTSGATCLSHSQRSHKSKQ